LSRIFLFLAVLLTVEQVSCQFWKRLADRVGGKKADAVQDAIHQQLAVEQGVPVVLLSNNNALPLIGLGVGNLEASIVPLMVASAVKDDKRTRMIDTSHLSNNEHLVADGINRGIRSMADASSEERITIHVVTKVWYTYLGYERTKISIQESVARLKEASSNPRVDLKLHILLAWPRCYDTISWMNCEKDEEKTPDHVKKAGSPPHLNKDAWKGSWRALEEAYLSDTYTVESIGVANFHLRDLQELTAHAKVEPHILQTNIWTLLYDPLMIRHCHENGVHIQVHNVMKSIVLNQDKLPNAYHHLLKTASELSESTPNGRDVSPAQTILAWLIQHGVSVVPQTSKLSRLQENSAMDLATIPELTDFQVESMAHTIEAFLSNKDLEEDIHVKVSFHATTMDTFLYWKAHDGDEVKVAFIPKGETYHDITYPNHSFRLYNAKNKDHYIDHKITATFGEHEDVHAEL